MNVVRSTDIHWIVKDRKRKEKSRAGGKDADDVGGREWWFIFSLQGSRLGGMWDVP